MREKYSVSLLKFVAQEYLFQSVSFGHLYSINPLAIQTRRTYGSSKRSVPRQSNGEAIFSVFLPPAGSKIETGKS